MSFRVGDLISRWRHDSDADSYRHAAGTSAAMPQSRDPAGQSVSRGRFGSREFEFLFFLFELGSLRNLG
jgi:hypothetical protein